MSGGLHEKYPFFSSSFNETSSYIDRFSEKVQNTKFHENPSSVSRVVPRGQTDRHGESTWQGPKVTRSFIYVVCLKRSVNGTKKQTKQKIQIN
jgi:hypothetical protein